MRSRMGPSPCFSALLTSSVTTSRTSSSWACGSSSPRRARRAWRASALAEPWRGRSRSRSIGVRGRRAGRAAVSAGLLRVRACQAGAVWSRTPPTSAPGPARRARMPPVAPRIYVTGHRNPDTDSIAAAVGYSELLNRLDPETEHVPVRLGEVNAQTRWVLERAQAPEPRFLPHIMLRVRDVMQKEFPAVRCDEDSVRDAGLVMAREDRDVLPVTDPGGCLVGVVTERALARRYIRESRETSSLVDTPTAVREIAEVLEGEALLGLGDEVAGRVWVHAMDEMTQTGIGPGDVVVIGD